MDIRQQARATLEEDYKYHEKNFLQGIIDGDQAVIEDALEELRTIDDLYKWTKGLTV